MKKQRGFVFTRILAVLLMIALFPLGMIQPVKADGAVNVSIQVKYGQTQARELFTKLNTFRVQGSASSEEASGDAISASRALTGLDYDFGLEQTAMERAVEIALSYDKKQENENLCCLVSDAAAVCESWTSDSNSKTYQNIMNSQFRYVGVGHVTYQGHDYWVAVFSDQPSGVADTTPLDATATRSVTIDSSYITERKFSIGTSGTLELNVGDYYNLSTCEASILVSKHNPVGEYCLLSGTVSAAVDDPSVVMYNGTSLVALKEGSAKVTLSYGGITSAYSVVVRRSDISFATIDAIADQSYTGYEIRPQVTVRMGGRVLSSGNYTVSYGNNIYIGTAYVTVTGRGIYTGSKTIYFRIVSPTVANATISQIADQTYTGQAIRPWLRVYVSNVLLREGTDYTTSYYNNINIGTATVEITGIGGYSGRCTATFRIVGPNLSAAAIEAIPAQLYTGSDIRPTITVTLGNTTLRQGTDYYVSYYNNRSVGTATVTVTGIGNYDGTKTTTFRILDRDLSNATVSSVDTQRYTGEDICPTLEVKIGSVVLRQNVDYRLTYRDNRKPGTASIEINGAGSYSGSKTVTFKIAEASLSSATVKVDQQTYTGKAKTPKVTVKWNGKTLVAEKDYEVTYSNNKKPGKATAVITGIGSFRGTKKVTFVIVPKKVVWRSVKPKTKAAALSWKKDSYAAGYELYRSKKKTSGYRRIGTLAKNSYIACTNTNLSTGTYYYKVRSYVVVDGSKYYSAFNAVKKVKIK